MVNRFEKFKKDCKNYKYYLTTDEKRNAVYFKKYQDVSSITFCGKNIYVVTINTRCENFTDIVTFDTAMQILKLYDLL